MSETQANNGQQKPENDLRLTVSEDKLTAYLSGSCADGMQQRDVQYAITDLIKENGVKFGLDAAAMRGAIDRLTAGESLSMLPIARGVPPRSGQDAVITQKVEIAGGVEGRELAPGRVDFRDRGPIPTVEEGTVLATLQKAVPGEPGRDIYGKVVRPSTPRMLRLIPGKGVELRDDGCTLVSKVRGMLSRSDTERFEVRDVLAIDGDVDLSTGHISFDGAVKVRGTIRSDFKVSCHTLEADTIEARAVIDVRGDLVVYAGVLGAMVRVGGNMAARYVRDAKIICRGNLTIENEIVQCLIQVGGRVRVNAPESRIVDSQLAAVMGVNAAEISCSRTEGTMIRIGVSPDFEKQYWASKKALQSALNQQTQIAEAVKAQEEELDGTEVELRQMIEEFHKTTNPKDRENQLTQINMIKPLREALRDGVEQGGKRLDELVFEIQRLEELIRKMEAVMPTGAVWLDVRSKADQGTLIRTPKTSLTLDAPRRSFSAREAVVKDPNTNEERLVVKLSPLRSGAI